jgi:hypothetical protein
MRPVARFALAGAVLTSLAIVNACGSDKPASEVQGFEDADVIENLGDGLFLVACKDGTTSIMPEDALKDDLVCNPSIISLERDVRSPSSSCTIPEGTVLEGSLITATASEFHIILSNQSDVNKACGNLRLSLRVEDVQILQFGAIRSQSDVTPNAPSFPSFPRFR